jgi:hypothetical protein
MQAPKPLTYEFPNIVIRTLLTANATIGFPRLVHELPPLAEHRGTDMLILYVQPIRRDAIFGMFIEKWDRVERLLGTAFYSVVGQSHETAETLFASYTGTKQIADVLLGLTERSLKPPLLKEFANLLDRVRKFATKRNKLIHGQWQMHVQLDTVQGPDGIVLRQSHGEWKRVYMPIGPSDREKIAVNPDDQANQKNVFTLNAIAREIRTLDSLLSDFQDLVNNHFPWPKMAATKTARAIARAS